MRTVRSQSRSHNSIKRVVCTAVLVCFTPLQPDNILVADVARGIVKLLDFGLSARPVHGIAHARIGTHEWSPEEVVTSLSGYNAYRVDAWMLGCVLFFMRAGCRPVKEARRGDW